MTTLILCAFGTIVVWAVLLLQVAPEFPSSMVGWTLLLVLGPPAYLCGEWFFDNLFSPEHGYAISVQPFSIKRIPFALSVAVPLSVIGWWLLRFAGRM